MARLQVTPELIIEMNELYLKIGTYVGVSRELGGSPSASTVKKYIIPNYVSKENKKLIMFRKDDLPEFAPEKFRGIDNWGDLCSLSKSEEEEITKLWDELII